MKYFFSLFVIISYSTSIYCQLTVNNDAPYDNPIYLVDAVLPGNGINTFNHQYQGDSIQIGYFDASESNLGINSGVVMSTGDIAILDPDFTGFSDFVNVNPVVTDPDLLDVANSVSALIGEDFTIDEINDVAVLEFDFIPSSDTINFKYIFASQEYFGYENTSFNYVFEFFISGPGIAGPYASPAGFPDGSINIATIEDDAGTILPVTISSVNATINPEYFVDNQALETVDDADGFTIPLTAVAVVQCGETYHIRLAIADGTDDALSSYVFLEENSFNSSTVNVINSSGVDTTDLEINCGSQIILTAEASSGSDLSFLWSTGETTQSINVGEGTYVVEIISDGCALISDTVTIVETPISLDLGEDIFICSSDHTNLNVKSVQDAQPPLSYLWSTDETSPDIDVSNGLYSLKITDSNGCEASDSLEVVEKSRPSATLTGGGNICDGQTDNFPIINVQLSGIPPFHFTYNNSMDSFQDSTLFHTYKIQADTQGYYYISQIEDSLCRGSVSNNIEVTYSSSSSFILGSRLMCDGDSTLITVQTNVDAAPYSLFLYNGSYNRVFENLTASKFQIYVSDSALYLVSKLVDRFNCESQTNNGFAKIEFKAPINPEFIASFDSVLCPVDSAIMLEAIPDGGVFSGKGVDFDGYFHPVNAFVGKSLVHYSFPNNCNEIVSIPVEVNCDVNLFVPNSFSPNYDFINDNFVIRGSNILEYELLIYSRWGEQLFHTKDMSHHWDGKHKGKVVANGVYSYSITAYGKDARVIKKNGFVNVVQ